MKKISDVHIGGIYTLIGVAATGLISFWLSGAYTTASLIEDINGVMVSIGLEKSENISELIQKINVLKTERDDLSTDKQELTTTNKQLQDENDELNKQIINLTEQIDVLKTDSNLVAAISEKNTALQTSIEQLQNELNAANTRISELEPLVAKYTVAPVPSGRLYIIDIDYFNKSGTMVRKEDTTDNLGINRTNVISTSDAYGWKYTYKANNQYNWVKGVIFLCYDGRASSAYGDITVYADGVEVDTYRAKSGKDPVEFAMNVSKATEVTVKFRTGGSSGSKNVFLSELYFE